MNVQFPHKWWSSLKSVVFGSSSSLPLLFSEDGGLVCESVGKADLLSDHFDSKQSREAVDLPPTCRPSPSLTAFAFRSREVTRLLLCQGHTNQTTICCQSYGCQIWSKFTNFRLNFARIWQNFTKYDKHLLVSNDTSKPNKQTLLCANNLANKPIYAAVSSSTNLPLS